MSSFPSGRNKFRLDFSPISNTLRMSRRIFTLLVLITTSIISASWFYQNCEPLNYEELYNSRSKSKTNTQNFAPETDKLENIPMQQNVNPTPLIILFWTSKNTGRIQEQANAESSGFFSAANASVQTCWGPFKSEKKPACIFTENKFLVNEADALLYIGTEEKGAPLPPRDKISGKSQIRILFLREAPFWFGIQKQKFPDDFNWTMTYRTDSEIVAPYGKFQRHPKSRNLKGKNLTSPLDLLWKDRQLNNHAISIPKAKLKLYTEKYLKANSSSNNSSNLVAWTVSHCQTLSRREVLVKELQKFIPVDIYGQCGPLKCTIPRNGKAWQGCYEELGKHYKFYLAFENNLCEDYVTEKFFYALKNNMVPIVYGGADYKKLAPPGSFISVLDFPSIPALVAFIQYLDKNPVEYLKYFLWKEEYKIVHGNYFCDMCNGLWRHFVIDPQHKKGRKLQPKYSKYYRNISDWWFNSKQNEHDSHGKMKETKEACRLPKFPQFHLY